MSKHKDLVVLLSHLAATCGQVTKKKIVKQVFGSHGSDNKERKPLIHPSSKLGRIARARAQAQQADRQRKKEEEIELS